jgi:hypothetical protein
MWDLPHDAQVAMISSRRKRKRAPMNARFIL